MPTGSVVKHMHDCTVTVRDGAALSQSFGLFTGEVQISNLNRKLRAVAAYQVRGRLTAVRHADREFPTFTLTIQLANFSGSVNADALTETATPGDVFNRLGTWGSAVSTLPVNNGGTDVFCVDMDIRLEGTDFGDAADHVLTLAAVHGRPQAQIAGPATWVVECTVYGDISGDLAIVEA